MSRENLGIPSRSSRPPRHLGRLQVALLLGCALLLLIAGAGDARAYALGEDWTHTLQVVADLRAAPPSDPLVVLLGDSIAREATVSDAVWASQIVEAGGPLAVTYNLSSRNRTLAENKALVSLLPRVPAVVFIGVSLCSFTSPRTSVTIQLPAPTASLPPYDQHPYGQGSILADAKKSRLADDWEKTRYSFFRRNSDSCARMLARLVGICLARGYSPVLLEMPMNTAVIGHRFDRPVARLRAACMAVAKRRHIPFLRFLARAGLASQDFADLWHIVEPGRSVCQHLLSTRSADLLDRLSQTGHAAAIAAD